MNLNDYVQLTRRAIAKIGAQVAGELGWNYGFCKTKNDHELYEYYYAVKLLRDKELVGEECLCPQEIEEIKSNIHRILGPECSVVSKDFTRTERADKTSWILQNPLCLAYDYTADYLASLCQHIGINFSIVEKRCQDLGVNVKITDRGVCDAIDLAIAIQEQKCDIQLIPTLTLQQCVTDFVAKIEPLNCNVTFEPFVRALNCGVSVDVIVEQLNCGVDIDTIVRDACQIEDVEASVFFSPSASVSPSTSASVSPSASNSPSVSRSPSPSAVPPGNITGSVKDTFGNGIGGVSVRRYADSDVDGEPDGALLQTVTTTGTGSWSMVNVTPGNYVVQATVPNYTIVSAQDITPADVAPNTNINDNTIPVTVLSGVIDSGNNFVFTPDTGTISGTVLDNLGSPIENAEINIYEDLDLDGAADSGTPVATVLTNASGVYTATGIPSGPYALSSPNRSYVIVLTVPLGYTMVSGIDVTDDADLVPNTDTTNNIIPCTLTVAEVDANNNFIITL